MVRALRTAGLALAITAVGVIPAASPAEPGGDQAAQPPSTRPPSTAVAVRATSPQAAAPAAAPSRAPAPVPVPSVNREPDPSPDPAVIAAVESDRAPGWQQRLGAAALDRLDYPWESLGFRVAFLPAKPGYLGLTFPEERRIDIFVRDGVTVDEVARNVAHELGHALDWTRNTAASRALYRQIRGIDVARGWFACSGCTDLSTPAGDFAETFSYWLLDGAFPSRSKLGAGSPTVDQLRLLAPLFNPA